MKPPELEVFYRLVARGQATLDEIASDVGRDRSTTHRLLSKLVAGGLVYKQSRTLKGGGYYHLYLPVEQSKIKEQAQQRVDEITGGLQRLVDNFGADFRKHMKTRIGATQ
jgi:predicted transcriptional regulator